MPPVHLPTLNLRIAPRLGLAFSALLALTLVLAALAASRLGELAQAYERVVAEQFDISGRADRARHNADIAVRKMLVLVDLARGARVQAYADIDAANVRLNQALAGLEGRSMGGDHGAAVADVLLHLQAYRDAYIDTADLIEADDVVAARAMIGQRTEPALNELSRALDQLTQRQRSADLAQTQALQAMIHTDREWIWALCGIAMLLGGGLAGVVARSIVLPLRRAEAVGLLLAQGQYRHRIPVQGGDEVGRLSEVINSLAQAVGTREQDLLRLADTDPLTGLAKRVRFIAQACERLAALGPLVRRDVDADAGTDARTNAGADAGADAGNDADAATATAVLICLDVDRLKHVNALLGFDAGDTVLKGAAQRLGSLFAGEALAARLGGGTFLLLVPLADGAHAEAVARRVRDAIEHPLYWQEHSVDLSVSMGMALYPAHGAEPEVLMQRAEQAMFDGKRQHQPLHMYSPSAEAFRRSHLSLLSELQTALKSGQLRQFLQPKVSPLTGLTLGAEALVRWAHPQRGWLPPSEFIPFAESTGRICQITQCMLEQAVATLAQWQSRGWGLTLSVNLSTLDLQDSGLVARIGQALRSHGVQPGRLQLEVTETGLMASGPDPVGVLHRLRALGVALSIDDFGTGQSSLAYLQRLPVNELKIDRSFVDCVDADPRRQALLRAIVEMGHSLCREVTAEGVETAAEMAVLTAARCDLVQGYLIAKPMATEAFETWHAARHAATVSDPAAAGAAAGVVQHARVPIPTLC